MKSMDDLPDVVKSFDFTDALFDLIYGSTYACS